MKNELNKIIQASVIKSNATARGIAEGIGKPYATLMREINPYDHNAKVSAGTLLDIMIRTGDHSPLQFMANILGMKLRTAAALKSKQTRSLGVLSHEQRALR